MVFGIYQRSASLCSSFNFRVIVGWLITEYHILNAKTISLSCFQLQILKKSVTNIVGRVCSSLCQRLGLTWSVRNKPRVRVLSAEGARVRWRQKTSEASLSPEAQEVLQSNHEGANTIFLTNKKLSLDKRLGMFNY